MPTIWTWLWEDTTWVEIFIYQPLRFYKCLNLFLRFEVGFEKTRTELINLCIYESVFNICLNFLLQFTFDLRRDDLTWLIYLSTYDFASTPMIFPPSSLPLFCLRPRYSHSWYFSELPLPFTESNRYATFLGLLMTLNVLIFVSTLTLICRNVASRSIWQSHPLDPCLSFTRTLLLVSYRHFSTLLQFSDTL